MNYSKEANNRKSSKKRRRRKRKSNPAIIILRLFLVIIVIGVFAVAGGALGAYIGIIESAPPLNTEDAVPESYTSIIYDSDGNEIDRLHGEENREYVKLSSIPLDLQNAVIAIEDERFYDHNGIDFRGILRAIVTNIKDRNLTQGASTITQQLMKNELLSSEKKWQRKLQEQYLSVNFEKELTEQLGSKENAKDYILELYLNTISLNHGLNGVEAASKFYFGKSVSELTLAECASIAGITKNPSAYSPLSNPEKNKERQTIVLDKMLELGYINQSEYDEAIAEDIYSNIVGVTKTEETNAVHSYFIDSVIVALAEQLMEEKSMSKQQAYNLIYSGGLKIYTTVDTNMQAILEDSYKNESLFPPKGNTLTATYKISIMDIATEEQNHLEYESIVNNQEEADAFAQSIRDEILNDTNKLVLDDLSITKSLQSAMVIMDYHNGEVKALIGGREKTGDLVFNRATQALRQPGSCFKVLAGYAPALDLNLFAPGTVIMDEPYTYNGWSPKNWYSGYRGASTVRQGVKDSLNILAAKVIVEVGVEKAFDYLINFGFTSLVESKNINGKIYSDITPATVLGGITDGVSVLELTAAYGTIANGGEYIKPIFYTKVIDHNGNVLLENTPEPKRVLKETTAYMLTDMMRDVITGGTGSLARFRDIKMPIAGKTGTTSDDKDLTFVGYTPHYIAGIWLGYDIPKKMTYDKSYHLLLWRDVMEKIHVDLDNKDFIKPSGLTSMSFCQVSGDLPIKDLCDHDYYGGGITTDISATDYKSSRGACSIHKSFTVDIKTGYLQGEYCPSEDVQEVILAIDEKTGAILNLPSNISEGKVLININEACPVHKDPPVAGPENNENITDPLDPDYNSGENIENPGNTPGDTTDPILPPSEFDDNTDDSGYDNNNSEETLPGLSILDNDTD